MKLTHQPLKGPKSSFLGQWSILHGNGELVQLKEQCLTQEELVEVSCTYDSLRKAVSKNQELSLEDYLQAVRQSHPQVLLQWTKDLIREDAFFPERTALLGGFKAIWYDQEGFAKEVLFNGSPCL